MSKDAYRKLCVLGALSCLAAAIGGCVTKAPEEQVGEEVSQLDSCSPRLKSWDWRTHGVVTPVKVEGNCNSSWAFAATGAVEGRHAIKAGSLVSLSEQQLVDCSGSYGNNGCEGGLMDNAFEYIIDNHGIDTEASYPYTAMDESCRYDATNVGATVVGYVSLPEGDEAALKDALCTGPVAAAIDAGNISFQVYASGVYDEENCSSMNPDHSVLVVGWGHDREEGDYWIVKNSWGTDWGEEGYIRMRRGKNLCGIASMASYPILTR